MKRILGWALLLGTFVRCGAALADEDTEAQLLQRLEHQEERIKILERRLEAQGTPADTSASSAQDERIGILERRLEIQDETAKTAVSSTPIVQASSKGFSFRSPDGANQVRLRGVLHVDGRFMQDDAGLGAVDTWQVTRARPIIEGTLASIVDFRFTPDFGQGRTVIQDAFVTARLTPELRITAGKFKSPFGLERLQSANDIRFIARAFPDQPLVPNRDIGLAFEGDLFSGRFSYAAGYSNGVIDGGSSEALTDADVDDNKELIVRLFAQPFANSDAFALRGLGFGIAAGRVDSTGTAAQPLLPAFRTSPQQTFFRYRAGTTPTVADGEQFRYSPQFYYYVGSFGLIGEYVQVSQEVSRATAAGLSRGTINNSAWQLATSWFLTGEEAAFRGYTPNSTFRLGESWGAFELTARYHELDIDDEAFLRGADSFADPTASASRASAIEVGLNWYLTQNLKWVLNYGITRFEEGTPTGDRDDEKFFLTRFALSF